MKVNTNNLESSLQKVRDISLKGISVVTTAAEKAATKLYDVGEKAVGVFKSEEAQAILSSTGKMLGTLGEGGKATFDLMFKATKNVTSEIKEIGSAALKYNATMEQYKATFETMLGSSERANAVMGELKTLSKETPFNIEELAITTQLLMDYGFSIEEAQSKLAMFGDISQGSADKMQKITKVFGEIASTGKVTMENINQMIQLGFNPLEEISKNTGEAMETLRERITQGTVSVAEITAAMQRSTEEGGTFFGAMEMQSQTVSGQLAELKDNFQQMTGEMFGGLSDIVGEQMLPMAIGWVEQLSTGFTENGTEGFFDAFGNIITELIGKVVEYAPKLWELIVKVLEQLVMAIKENSKVIFESAVGLLLEFVNGFINGIPLIITTATELIYILMGTLDSQGESIVQNGVKMIENLIIGIVENLPTFIVAIINLILEMVAAINGEMSTIINTGIKIIMALIKGLVSALPDILLGIASIVLSIGEAFLSFDYVEIGKSIVEGIIEGLAGMLSSAVETVKKIASNIFEAAKEVLGIHSPSRKFKYIGEMCVAGWEEGSEDLFSTDTIARDINATLSVAKANVAGAKGLSGSGGYTQNVYVNRAVSTPDEVARAIRVESRYGLMGGVAFA